MSKFASKATRGFYDLEIHGDNLPSDAVEISDAHHSELINGQAIGKIIDWSGSFPVLTDPPPPTLTDAQSLQIAEIEASYQSAIQLPVSYMGTTFQADATSQDVLTKSLAPGSVPSGFFWLDANNNQVPMTFQQLQGLAAAMLAQGQTAFAKKTMLKQQVRSATTVSAVQAITWS